MLKKVLLVAFIMCMLIPATASASRREEVIHFPQMEPTHALSPYSVEIYTKEEGPHALRVKGYSEMIPFIRVVREDQPDYYYAVIPGEQVTEGVLQYRVETRSGPTEWYKVQVGPPLPYTDDDVQTDDINIRDMSIVRERWFYDVGAFRTTLPGGEDISNVCYSLRSPARQAGNPSVDVWPSINSPHNTTRSLSESNPHRGMDLNIPNHQNVYAMLEGTVEYVVPSGTQYVYIRTKHDVNGDGTFDLRIRYEHCLSSLTVGQAVYYNTVLGQIDAPAGYEHPNHLHLKFEGKSGSSYLSLSQRLFFKNRSQYGYGGEVDFIKEPVGYSDGTLTVEVYGTASGTRTYASAAKVYHRRAGTTTWYAADMTKQSSTNWIANLKTIGGYSNCTVQYYIEAKRAGYEQIKAHRKCYYNVYWNGTTYVSDPPPASEAFSYYII